MPRWLRAAATMAVVAVVTATTAAALALAVDRVFERVLDAPSAVVVVLPGAALVVNAVARWLGRRCGPASTDAYIDAYHGAPVDSRRSIARIAGGTASVAGGAALDLAGVGVLIGATVAERAQRWAARTDLLVLGAAAGLGATLQSPIAGGVLAVELPFRDRADWRRLPLAVVGSATGFVARGVIDDVRLPFRTDIGVVGVRDVLLALAVALAAGFASRLVSWLADRAQTGLGPVFGREWHHVLAGAVALTALAAVSLVAFDEVPVTLGPGPVALGWAASGTIGLLGLFAVRAMASGASVLGRGTGGLLVPLLVLGWIGGHALGHGFDGNTPLLATVAAAALLGAAHRVPLAAVVWLAESTHSVPATAVGGVAVLVAASVAGGRSVSSAQRRTG